jgi:hypothetical protein
MQEILKDEFLRLEVVSYDLHENFETGASRIACQVKDTHSGDVRTIEGRGEGVLDAFFHGVKEHLASSYSSLKTLRFASFEIRGDLETGRRQSGSDAEAVAVLVVRNAQGRDFEFKFVSRSILKSGIEATLEAAEYFVNSERAFVTVHNALGDARKKNRSDLVEKYTNMLAQLVENSSYSELIEQRKREGK